MQQRFDALSETSHYAPVISSAVFDGVDEKLTLRLSVNALGAFAFAFGHLSTRMWRRWAIRQNCQSTALTEKVCGLKCLTVFYTSATLDATDNGAPCHVRHIKCKPTLWKLMLIIHINDRDLLCRTFFFVVFYSFAVNSRGKWFDVVNHQTRTTAWFAMVDCRITYTIHTQRWKLLWSRAPIGSLLAISSKMLISRDSNILHKCTCNCILISQPAALTDWYEKAPLNAHKPNASTVLVKIFIK